jgi:hypothetical protein
MHRVVVLWIVLLLVGCAAPPVVPPGPASQPVARVPAGKVRIQFEKFDCFCHVAGVEQALLELPSVSALDWDVTEYRVLLDVKDPPPGDRQIEDALLYSGVKIARIERP